MNCSQLASSGYAFTGSHCVAQGNFQSPETILDAVLTARSVRDGVIAISGQGVTGRIAVINNTVISGGIVNGTGESGISAVYKLLLVPRGSFVFRQALPQDQWQLQQELGLNAIEVKELLAGPSSIGLAEPTSQRAQVSHVDETSASDDLMARYADDSRTLTMYSRLRLARTYNDDCSKLVSDTISQTCELSGVFKRPIRAELKPQYALPKRVQKKRKDSHSIGSVLALIVVASFAAFVVLPMGLWKNAANTATAAASTEGSGEVIIEKPIEAPVETPKRKSASFMLPHRGSQHSAAPANTTARPSDSETARSDKDKIVDSKKVSFWAQTVRTNPNDPVAREQLAYALLSSGDATVSVQQFQAMMVLRTVQAEEIERFVDALLVYDQPEVAKQFLQSVISGYPSQQSLSRKLARLEQ